MIASLMMYLRPETAAATDRFWGHLRAALADHGIATPETLDQTADPWEVWQSPDLVLSQTCGLPLRARLMGRVAVVGVADHQLPGCAAGQYHSVILARRGADLPARSRLAVNDALSQSGWANLLGWLESSGTARGAATLTGAHVASARAVADGDADLAAIDAQTWELITRHDPFADALQVIARTPPIAGLPYIAPLGADIAAYRAALSASVAALSAEDRGILNLHGIVPASAKDYADRKIPPAP